MVTQMIQKWQRFARCKEARHLPRMTRLIHAEARCFGAIQIRVKSVLVELGGRPSAEAMRAPTRPSV
jgi:hypothetical protein